MSTGNHSSKLRFILQTIQLHSFHVLGDASICLVLWPCKGGSKGDLRNEILYRFVVIGRGTFGCPGTLIGHPTARSNTIQTEWIHWPRNTMRPSLDAKVDGTKGARPTEKGAN